MKKITIYRVLSMDANGETVNESFTVYPEHSFLFDEYRDVYYKINYIVNFNNLLKYYERVSSTRMRNGWWNVYKYDSKVEFREPMVATFSFEYIASGGKKTCDKCIFYKKFDSKKYCWHRGQKLKDNYWHKCLYWHEDANWWKRSLSGGIHKQERQNPHGGNT